MYSVGRGHHWKWADACTAFPWAVSWARGQNWTRNLGCTSNLNEAPIWTCMYIGSSEMAPIWVLLKQKDKISHHIHTTDRKGKILKSNLKIPVRALLRIMFPIEWPTKLSLISLQPPFLEYLSTFLLRNATTSLASLLPISLKSPDVLSSFIWDSRHSAPGSSKSHWFLTRRKSKWCPCLF